VGSSIQSFIFSRRNLLPEQQVQSAQATHTVPLPFLPREPDIVDAEHGKTARRHRLVLFLPSNTILVLTPSTTKHPGHPALKPATLSAADNSVPSWVYLLRWAYPILLFYDHPATSSAYLHMMADNAAAPPKPSSSVKLVLLGEAAVGKVRRNHRARSTILPLHATSPPLRILPCGQAHDIEANVCAPRQSSLVLRFVNNDFQENKEPTIGGTVIPRGSTIISTTNTP